MSSSPPLSHPSLPIALRTTGPSNHLARWRQGETRAVTWAHEYAELSTAVLAAHDVLRAAAYGEFYLDESADVVRITTTLTSDSEDDMAPVRTVVGVESAESRARPASPASASERWLAAAANTVLGVVAGPLYDAGR